jgi:hypothetical protein
MTSRPRFYLSIRARPNLVKSKAAAKIVMSN